MKKATTFLALFSCLNVFALDGNHFTITRISAPYFIVDGNSPATITKAYVGFEVKNNSNSGTNYTNLKFTVTSINTSVPGQNYTLIAPSNGIINVGTLAPGQTRVCYYYVEYPANVSPQATFNVELIDTTTGVKTQSFIIYNRSSISANAGGTATQTFTNQDMLGAIVTDDVTYKVGNVQNGDENDFQVAVSTSFDPTLITLLGTEVLSSSVPGINAGTTDSLYFITGNGSNGDSVTIRWTFRITATNFTTYLLPCAGATSGNTNYKYALNTNLGAGTPITVTSSANPLTITKTSDQSLYGTNAPAVFTITINNPGIYGVTIDSIVDQLPPNFTFQSIHGTSQVTTSNSTSTPGSGATGSIKFEGSVVSGGNLSYYVPAGGSIILRYTSLTSPSALLDQTTTVRIYIGATEAGSAENTVSVSATLPVTLEEFKARRNSSHIDISWVTSSESNTELFEIERGSTNQNFENSGTVMAKGINGSGASYQYSDISPLNGKNYYRLKIVDQDGNFKYGPVALVVFNNQGVAIDNIFPNPFYTDPVIRISSLANQQAQLSIIDLAGRILFSVKLGLDAGSRDICLPEINKLQAGTYLLHLRTGDESRIRKFVKL